MPEVASLTQAEAAERAALIDVQRYDIAVDMRGLLDGDTLESVSTITFTCREPGAATFLDCVADVRWATLNDRPLDLDSVADGRIPLRDLAAENVVVVSAAQSDTASSAGILRTVDPSDKLVYVWTSFEPDAARRVWACFDQPDLKAPHGFTVLAPDAWLVTSNSAPGSVDEHADGGRRWAVPRHPAAVDLRRRRQRRAVPRDPRGAGRPQPGALLPPVAQDQPRARRRAPVRAHRPGTGVLRGAVRPALPAGTLRPGLRAQHGWRDGELGLRHVDRQRAPPQPAHPRPARERRQRAAARDGAHVVRRPGDHAVVGRPVAERGVRVLGGELG